MHERSGRHDCRRQAECWFLKARKSDALRRHHGILYLKRVWAPNLSSENSPRCTNGLFIRVALVSRHFGVIYSPDSSTVSFNSSSRSPRMMISRFWSRPSRMCQRQSTHEGRDKSSPRWVRCQSRKACLHGLCLIGIRFHMQPNGSRNPIMIDEK
jgi:hypothetical protein